MIDKRVSNSKKLGKISDRAARLYFMIYPHLDCEGRIAFDDLGDLKIEVIPYLAWSTKKIETSLNELADVGLINLYPFDNKIAMEFTRFEDFQTGLRKDREAQSEIPQFGATPANSGNFRIFDSKFKEVKEEGRKEGIGNPKNNGKIFFNFQTEEWENISEKDLSRWEKTYPKCDLSQELLYMADWLLADPRRRKSNYKKFITNWLKRTQDGGGTKGNSGGKGQYKPSQIGKSAKKTTPEQKEYLEARRKKEREVQEKHKKEIAEIRKKGDTVAAEVLREKMDEEVREWSREYLEERGA